MENRNEVVRNNFIRYLEAGQLPKTKVALSPQQLDLSAPQLMQVFESQVLSRHLDLQSRRLQARGQSFYTIGSAGHEGNAVLGQVFRPTDMAFLHYRSGAFLIERARQRPGQTPVYDMLLSFCASAEDPVSGGRHKVLGSKTLQVPPQTSTIASHLPKAVGAAYSVPLAQRVGVKGEIPGDSVVLCNFGDASANHSTAQGAINAAAWTAYQQVPLPLVFICEDNGIGISTRTPDGWVAANFAHRPGLHYLYCDGLNLLDVYHKARQAEQIARYRQQPVFLHMRTVRLLGHAGSDAEIAYRDLADIETTEFQDPLLHSARLLLEHGIADKQTLIDLYQRSEQRVTRVAEHALGRPRLNSAEAVMDSIVPPTSKKTVPPVPDERRRQALFARERHNLGKAHHMAKLLNWTLTDIMAQYDNALVFGEDVGQKGGVYHVTSRLVERFGKNRVINTLLDEQSILGLAIGSAQNGFLPIPEIQFLAYVHNAEDQIRGEAATQSFFSKGQFTNPMVIRIAGLAYQKGFGGHFHNDNSLAVFRDIPGVILACPSNGGDAVEMLRSCVRLAYEQQRVVIFLEPIALYMTRDLHEQGDNLWCFDYVEPGDSQPIELGQYGQYGSGCELAIVTYGNGYYFSRQAARQLEDKGVSLRVIDLRWLIPLNREGLLEAISGCEHVLVVDECRQSGSVSEEILATVHEGLSKPPKIQRLTGHDSFIPLGSAAYEVLPDVERIIAAANELLGTNSLSQSA